jgi:hypothetical protein
MEFKHLCPRLKFLDFAENPQLLGCGQRVSDYYQCKLISLTCRFNFRVIAGGHNLAVGNGLFDDPLPGLQEHGIERNRKDLLAGFFTL